MPPCLNKAITAQRIGRVTLFRPTPYTRSLTEAERVRKGQHLKPQIYHNHNVLGWPSIPEPRRDATRYWKSRSRGRTSTHRLSKLPIPTRQNPNAHIAPTTPKSTIPLGPRTGKFRLYLIASYPPAGGISLQMHQLGLESLVPREGWREGSKRERGLTA